MQSDQKKYSLIEWKFKKKNYDQIFGLKVFVNSNSGKQSKKNNFMD
jgi:hypothetical protein